MGELGIKVFNADRLTFATICLNRSHRYRRIVAQRWTIRRLTRANTADCRKCVQSLTGSSQTRILAESPSVCVAVWWQTPR